MDNPYNYRWSSISEKSKEIMKYSPFRPLKYSSLGKLYKRAKDRLEADGG